MWLIHWYPFGHSVLTLALKVDSLSTLVMDCVSGEVTNEQLEVHTQQLSLCLQVDFNVEASTSEPCPNSENGRETVRHR